VKTVKTVLTAVLLWPLAIAVMAVEYPDIHTAPAVVRHFDLRCGIVHTFLM